jgi:hypothetical protein
MDKIDDITKNTNAIYNIFGKDEKLNDIFYSTHLPIKYKELTFYPVKTGYFQIFHILAQVFWVTKYDSGISDPKVMGMTNFGFLFYQNKDLKIDNYSSCLPQLELLLLICMNKFDLIGKIADSNFVEHFITFKTIENKYYFIYQNSTYDFKDYENIKSIICEQNSLKLPDYNIHPDIRKKLEEKDRLMARVNENKIGSFEELVDCLMLATHYGEEDIYNLSIRRFVNLLNRYGIFKDYELYTLLSPYIDKKDRNKFKFLSWNSAIPKKDSYYSKVQNIQEIKNQLDKMNNMK